MDIPGFGFQCLSRGAKSEFCGFFLVTSRLLSQEGFVNVVYHGVGRFPTHMAKRHLRRGQFSVTLLVWWSKVFVNQLAIRKGSTLLCFDIVFDM
jgi:hypothetical protein